jgi:uncharacterized protein (DUF1778 family)
MDDLNKTEQINIRISLAQKEWLAEAAQVVSRERGELVDPATLARELIVAGTEEIRSRSEQKVA